MIQNQPLKRYELKLKQFIQKSIHHQALADCEVLMSRPKLDLFYQQLQQHLFQQKLKKNYKERRYSLGNQLVMNLNEKKSVKMITQPEWIPSRAMIKSRVSLGKIKRKSVDDGFQPQKTPIKHEIEEDVDYFVRMIKNPKAIRYMKSKACKEQPKQAQILNKKRQGKKPKLMNTNFEQRKKILQTLKKSKNFRHSTIAC